MTTTRLLLLLFIFATVYWVPAARSENVAYTAFFETYSSKNGDLLHTGSVVVTKQGTPVIVANNLILKLEIVEDSIEPDTSAISLFAKSIKKKNKLSYLTCDHDCRFGTKSVYGFIRLGTPLSFYFRDGLGRAFVRETPNNDLYTSVLIHEGTCIVGNIIDAYHFLNQIWFYPIKEGSLQLNTSNSTIHWTETKPICLNKQTAEAERKFPFITCESDSDENSLDLQRSLSQCS